MHANMIHPALPLYPRTHRTRRFRRHEGPGLETSGVGHFVDAARTLRVDVDVDEQPEAAVILQRPRHVGQSSSLTAVFRARVLSPSPSAAVAPRLVTILARCGVVAPRLVTIPARCGVMAVLRRQGAPAATESASSESVH